MLEDARENTESDKTRIHTHTTFFSSPNFDMTLLRSYFDFYLLFFFCFFAFVKKFFHPPEARPRTESFAFRFLSFHQSLVFGGCLRFIFFVVVACWGNRVNRRMSRLCVCLIFVQLTQLRFLFLHTTESTRQRQYRVAQFENQIFVSGRGENSIENDAK